MIEIEIGGAAYLTADTVDGVLQCHIKGNAACRDVVRLVAVMHRLAIQQRAFGVLVRLASPACFCDLSAVKDAVMAAALPVGEFRPWAWVVPRDIVNEWIGLGHRLCGQGLVTGVFTEQEWETAAAYLGRHGPLWLAERRWLVAASPRAAERGQCRQTPSDVPRPN